MFLVTGPNQFQSLTWHLDSLKKSTLPTICMISTLVLIAAGVNAWGSEGHQIVGQVAQAFLSSAVAQQVDAILGGKSLGEVSTWADTIKRKPGYEFTRSLHYVDVGDEATCVYNDDRDCANGQCIVGALELFSKDVACTNNGVTRNMTEAVKFITHFVGDITQPLHTCGRERGGNDVKVDYGGKTVNLHSMWDTSLVRDRSAEMASSQDAYVSYLIKQIKTGTYRASSAGWVSQAKIQDVTANGNSVSAIEYAIDSDQLNCLVVWASYDENPNQDFSLDYYKKVAPLIDLQLAKGGYRLAAWLNSLLGSC